MKFAALSCWVFSGMLLAASGVYAQEAASQNTGSKTTKVSAKKTKPVTKKAAKPDARAIRSQREAEARAQAEQEARQRAAAAEAAAIKQAEIEARAKAEQEARQRAATAEAAAIKQAEIEAREKPLREADDLIKNGKPADAYSLLEPLEFDRSGEVRFDYLIGIAALDSGKPDKATLAFERVLAVDRNFAGARLDMARAYYQLGDLPRARAEFETVLAQNPPEAARLTIQKYLDVIAAREKAKGTQLAGYIEGTVGYDSNVNNSTGQSQIAVPAFGNLVFTLNPSNVKMSDNYAGTAAGAEFSHLLNESVALYAGVDVRQRGNNRQAALDYFSVDERAGLSFTRGAEMFRAGVSANQYTLASTHNRDTVGVNADWRHTFSPSNQMSVFAQFNQNRFVDAMKANDFDQSTVGAGWLHVMPDGKSALFGSLFYGHENDTATGGRADGSKSLTGLRIGGQASVGDSTELFASLGAQRGGYDKNNAAFMKSRVDRSCDISLGVNWHADNLWTVRPQVSWSRNDSNIAIYEYGRMDVSVAVRRDFR